jgi:hypothetical protein
VIRDEKALHTSIRFCMSMSEEVIGRVQDVAMNNKRMQRGCVEGNELGLKSWLQRRTLIPEKPLTQDRFVN